ncbi:MAG: hypothetical protein HPY83_10935 [Anaerolineae bacterium]|nr:hypothetical protein [Anaerolineae bacterium]
MDPMELPDKLDWPLIQQRYEAWWEGEVVDRVPIAVHAPKAALPEEDVAPEQLVAYWTDPETVMERQRRVLAATYYGGDAFPVLRPVSGGMVAVLAAFLGAPLHILNRQTTWTEPIIADWDYCPPLGFDPTNPWWMKVSRLLEAGAREAPGYAYVSIPDLNGPGEILARLRGAERLAVDLIEHPGEVLAALPRINQAWYRYWQACNGIIHQHVGGYVFWMGLWSERPAVDLQTDFSIMISREMFDRFFLPFVEEQTRLVPRTVYHLDGPGAARHLDSLLALPRLTAIQWVPGAGAPPMSRWLPLLRRVQARGKGLCLFCEPWEVSVLLNELEPEGLFLSTSCDSPEEADALVALAQHAHRRRSWLVPGTEEE